MIYYIAAIHLLLFSVFVANMVYLWRGRKQKAPDVLSRLSVLIPARNEEANLQRLLPSLLRQDYPDFEVIVYDDGSEDGTWEVIHQAQDDRLRAMRGSGPPPGWVGKVHALYQATREASGDVYLFLDADAEFLHPSALCHLAAYHSALPEDSVMTGLTRLLGGGKILVSLVQNAILTGLPWPLVRPLPFKSLGALNGQCWLIRSDLYHRYEPHEALKNEVLEDVRIGRYLKENGVVPVLRDLQQDVAIHMYRDLPDAWQGFRKNAYLILTGKPFGFVILALHFLLTYVLAPFIWPWFLLSIYLLKLATDLRSGFPRWITTLAPVSYVLAVVMQWDSAISHWTGRVAWKGRNVGPRPEA